MCPNDVSESTGICNMFQWYYISPFPVDLLALGISAFIVLAILAYLEYRRRLKRAAMERYAIW